MRGKWVDNSGYLGPDRRRAGDKRMFDRRKADDAGARPSLHAMLRRLRVLIVDFGGSDNRARIMALVNAAITEAETMRMLQCADALGQAKRALMSPQTASRAESFIVQAIDRAAEGR
jgi:hypothetical protein